MINHLYTLQNLKATTAKLRIKSFFLQTVCNIRAQQTEHTSPHTRYLDLDDFRFKSDATAAEGAAQCL